MTEKPKYKYEDIESEDIEKLFSDDLDIMESNLKDIKNDTYKENLNEEDRAC